MKNLVAFVLFLCMFQLLFPNFALASEEVILLVNGEQLLTEPPAQIIEGRTYLPLRAIAEAMGCDLSWNSLTQQAVVHKQDRTLFLTIDSTSAVVDGQKLELDAPARVICGRTMVPVRFFASAFMSEVSWDPQTRSVLISFPIQEEQDMKCLGFYAIRSYPSFMERYEVLDQVSTSWFTLTADGTVLKDFPVGYESVLKTARENDIETYACIFQNDPEVLRLFLENEAAKAKAVSDISKLLEEDAYDGINLDIENIPPDLGSAYTGFLVNLKAEAGGAFKLAVTVSPKALGEIDWHEGLDYEAIGAVADLVIVMAYNEHYFSGGPGPVASLPWLKNVMNYTIRRIPPHKVSVALGIYGIDWEQGGPGRARDLSEIKELIATCGGRPEWDENAKSPVFEYTSDDGALHEVWYETEESIRQKLTVLHKYNVNGIALWRLGIIPPYIWDVVRPPGTSSQEITNK